MAYDTELAERVRDRLAHVPVEEQRMFGGLAFLLGGHLAVAVSGRGGLLVRTDPERWVELQGRAGVEPMEMRGRPMTGWLHVDLAKVRTAKQLDAWVEVGLAHVQSLPPKPPKPRRR